MSWEAKSWGQRLLLLSLPQCEVWLLKIQRGGYSSRHRHRVQWNRFYILSGSLQLELEDGSRVGLPAGDAYTIAPGLWHRFRAPEDCLALELVWNELLPGDIEREDEGGRAAGAH